MRPYHATTHDGRRITFHAPTDKEARQFAYAQNLTNVTRSQGKDRP